MATKARQQYFADEDSLQKIRREFSIADDIQQKIDSIEPWAQVNKIETVKVNWTALVPDANKAVNVEVPEVIDNLYTVDSDNALSAKQWKLLYDYIQNIASRWRFLSNWNSATGLPMTNPSENPYPYKSWDYFIVSNVAWLWGTNYRPDGSSYIIWQASTVVETNSVDVSDFYFYDGTNWLLLSNSGRQIAVDTSLSTTSTNPVENRVITNALNNKQDILTAWNHIDITNNVISAEWFQEELTAWENITIEDVCATESDMQWPAPSGFHVPLTTEWQWLKAIMDWLSLTIWNDWRINLHLPFAGYRSYSSARDGLQGDGGRYWSSTPRDSDMAYILSFGSTNILPQNVYERAYGCSVRCFKNSFTVPTSSWTVINGTLWSAWIFRNQTEWIISITSDWTTWYTIQDKNLWATTVYNNWDTLSETNCGYYYQRWNNYWFPRTWSVTTSSTQVDASNYWPWNYYNSDTFIIWSGDWSNVQNDNLWWWVSQWTYQECIHNVISATDTKYTAWTWINIDSNNVISSTATSAQWWNITWTLSNQTDLQSALDSKVNLWINKVFDTTTVQIWKWEHEPGGDSSGHHIELDPSWEVSTYNLTQAWHNEATLWSWILTVIKNTAIWWNEEAVYSHESIVADNWTDTETYNFFGNNRIARLSDVGWTYSAWNWIDIDANNEISIDTTVVATQTDVNNKVSKWINQISGQLFSIEDTYGNSTNFWPDYIRIDFNDWIDSGSAGFQRDGLWATANNKISNLTSDSLALKDDLNLTQTTYAEDEITVVDNWYWTSETYQFSWWWNNQIARLKDVKTYTAWSWININANNEISNTLPWPTIAATAPTGTEWALWYDTTNDVLMAYNWTAWKEAWTQMKVLSYGHSTWQDFIDAYNENAIVYCRASSNSNPASWTQWRMAFMAFVSINSWTWLPTSVEFQYYRSRSDHNTQANQLDQVFVYTLTNASWWTWSVTERNTWAKAVAWTWISLWWGSGNMTISADTSVLATKTDLNSKQDTLVSWTNIKTVNNESLLWSWNITIQSWWVTSVNGQTWAVTVNDVKVWNTAPSNPTDWIVWYDTDLYNLQVYNWSTHQWDTLNNIFHMVTPWVWDDMADYINILEDSWSRLLIFSFNENMSDLWIVTDYGRENWDEQTQKYENFKITAIWNVSDNADTTFIQNWWLTRPKWIATLEIIWTHQLDTYVCSTVQFKESWWLKVAPNSPITWIKYVWYGTEADYANLSQYYTDTPWDTEFHCF